ncbi:hypothetical protein PAXRUDRAFT_22802 [Paxillus rubicundulus Ve08.2h10]|uniref:Uncharacterized protein n=1 Tax=Paxillus rubicundulus Ve08.2h10 TaxID=930991 RepID=A0A0D0CML0_9AGAM|nr:hypothetical protein PAXRUDRAFT_22802 [Paxillus rubicundulus Ve08.2h10]
MLPTQRTELMRQLYGGVLLGCPLAFSSHVPQEITIFSQGFDVVVSEALPSFAASLRLSIKTIITQMYQQRITSPSQLIDRLEWEVAQCSETESINGNLSSVIDTDTEVAFIIRFTRYLRGVGHPTHPVITNYISVEDQQVAEGNTTFRCEQFMLQVSGSCLLPADPNQRIYVRFTKGLPQKYAHTRPQGAEADWEPSLHPMQFQTCSYRVNIPLTRALLACINGPVPVDDNIVTDFDIWIHSSIFSFAGSTSFNIL